MKILIIKNISREGPGLLSKILDEHNINYDIIDLDKGENFPDPKKYSAVVVLGGPESANDKTPKIKRELKKIKEAINNNIPYFGICLGMQMLVKACGGEVYKHNIKEVGWEDDKDGYFKIDFTEEGKKDPLFRDLNTPLKIFQLHGETVSLTPKMKLLATGKHCKNQVVKLGNNAYGIQGHFELTKEMFEEWITKDQDLLKKDSSSLRKDYYEMQSEYESVGKQIIVNFLRIAKLIS